MDTMAVARGLALRISTVYAMVINRVMVTMTAAAAVTMMKLFLIVGAGVCTMPIWLVLAGCLLMEETQGTSTQGQRR